jgi:hypothetical protein
MLLGNLRKSSCQLIESSYFRIIAGISVGSKQDAVRRIKARFDRQLELRGFH